MVRCSDVEADKSVVDYVSEALLHILRNAVDHGIESPEERLAAGKDRRGKITFWADNVAEELRMTISDDGKGIDEERVRERARQKGLFASADPRYDPQKIREFILYPSFSTNEKLLNIPAGRGSGCSKEHYGRRGGKSFHPQYYWTGKRLFHISSLESGIYRVRAFPRGPVPLLHTGPACISFSGV